LAALRCRNPPSQPPVLLLQFRDRILYCHVLFFPLPDFWLFLLAAAGSWRLQ
jgi:hypothetical protein